MLRRKSKINMKVFLFGVCVLSNLCFGLDIYKPRVIVELEVGAGDHQLGDGGVAAGCLVAPGLVYGDRKGDLYLFDSHKRRILKYNKNGKFLLEIKGACIGIGMDKEDNLYTLGDGALKIFSLMVFNSNGQKVREQDLTNAATENRAFVSWSGNVSITLRGGIYDKASKIFKYYNNGYKFDSNGKNTVKIENSEKDIAKEDVNFYEDANGDIWDAVLTNKENIKKGKENAKFGLRRYKKEHIANGLERKKLDTKEEMKVPVKSENIIGFDGKKNVYIYEGVVRKYSTNGDILAEVQVPKNVDYIPGYYPTIDYYGNIYACQRSNADINAGVVYYKCDPLKTKVKIICYELQK